VRASNTLPQLDVLGVVDEADVPAGARAQELSFGVRRPLSLAVGATDSWVMTWSASSEVSHWIGNCGGLA
jgi:hypothetical protein